MSDTDPTTDALKAVLKVLGDAIMALEMVKVSLEGLDARVTALELAAEQPKPR